MIYTDAIEVNLTNDRDFLMYDWDDISDAAIGSVGYNNFIVPESSLLSQFFWKDETPYVIALVRYDYSDMDGYIGSYVTYVKAEPVK